MNVLQKVACLISSEKLQAQIMLPPTASIDAVPLIGQALVCGIFQVAKLKDTFLK